MADDRTDIANRRRMLEHAQRLAKTTNAQQLVQALAGLLDSLGTLLSGWTGQSVRVQVTAIGQAEAVDMTKAGPAKH